MFPLRCIRRRSLDILLKGGIIFTVCLFIVQITSSHPKGGISQRTLDEGEPHVQKRENQEIESTEQKLPLDGKSKVIKNPFLSTEPKKTVIKKAENSGFYKNIMIHFDLKGAPPKVEYFKKLLRLIAEAGATGILLEWEDMFPWKGEIEKFKSTDAYSDDDVDQILKEAVSLDLEIVPLVQTFGHLEWILKYEETRKYRENDAYPQVLCLGNEEGVNLVKEALRQVIEVHSKYGLKMMHIGADEAFEFGVCKESIEWIRKNGGSGGKQLLALAHLKNIAEYVKKTATSEITVLAWHDMLKDFDSRLIHQLDLGNFIEPVVWDYSENIVTLNDYIFSTLAENFPTMWASSAYKGANYPSASQSEVGHYEKNNRRWLSTKSNQERKFKNGFHGIIITGWQRYDHLAGLCEILPIGTASMILQLQTALGGPNRQQDDARKEAGRILKCKSFRVEGVQVVATSCDYPGFNTYLQYQNVIPNTFSGIERELGANHHLMGWANRYNAKYNISQNWYHREMLPFVDGLLNRYNRAEQDLRTSMSDLFFQNTIDEFVYENLGPMSEKLNGYKDNINRLNKLRTWPKRHFPLKTEL